LGYLRYCKNCGVPVHKLCIKNGDLTCKGCGKYNVELTSDVINVEKAFTPEP